MLLAINYVVTRDILVFLGTSEKNHRPGITICNTTRATQEAKAGGSQVQSLLSQKQERREGRQKSCRPGRSHK